MKKFTCIALILVLTLSLMAGCRRNSGTDAGDPSMEPSSSVGASDNGNTDASGKGTVGDVIDDMTGNMGNGMNGN